ncbi:glutaredoxin family protein [Corynebacterium liangguodongii]|uniref:Thioredoxin family protein n=1 Tax=Corynebacterium liangguodongii TaxID=2079535 RepID=A0A2S0WGT2_9CORY|nr:glutaredoxin family protein [Corynebacterium liangguodongii]AWB84987.1 thioredoxin family protein [Corynebacterium liangguodongii]PWC00693.1 glutaredoxin family protein [Corynebacterium liangguodongii]
MVRATCGSCGRVARQIAPIVESAGASFELVDVDTDPALAIEFGDRVPVVVIDGDEFACWEVDDEALAAELAR